MSAKLTYFCDECGTQKRETNHWFQLLEYTGFQPHFEVTWWSEENANSESLRHLCSESCLLKRISSLIRQPPVKYKAMCNDCGNPLDNCVCPNISDLMGEETSHLEVSE